MASDSWPDLAGLVVETCHDVYGRAAIYHPASGAATFAVRVLLRSANEELDLVGGRFAARGQTVELLASQVPKPVAGDELQLQDASGLRLRLQGEPRLEAEGTLWLCDVHEVSEP